ncbi:hypothetical protein [Psychrobacillus sp. FSL H8-0487]|uniref:hypothetical protein n=1 Tax=Psychrobacillus sp. FSL H8-0487 TaxID=2921391 RepID=UPI0030FA7F55
MSTNEKYKYLIMVAAFRSETNENRIYIGNGFTIIEAIVRSIEYDLSDEEIQNIIYIYGPDDFEGLQDWYISRGIYISDPEIIEEPVKGKPQRIK